MTHSGQVFRNVQTYSDVKSLYDCVCRGEIQLNYDLLWITVDYPRNMYAKINHHSTAITHNTRASKSIRFITSI